MNMILIFKNLRIRYKLLFGYWVAFCIVLALGSVVMYSIVRKTIEANIESELKNSTEALLNMVRTSVSISIKNHLRAVAEKNLEMIRHIYGLYEKGELTEAQAKKRATGLLLSQKIGTTGYIACVSSNGIMLVHPEKAFVNKDINDHAFVAEMRRKKNGYIEYDWKNPGDMTARPKALYMSYFEPWDWIINVSSYRKEFQTLVNIDDFRQSILSLQFGRTGYSFVTDKDGNIIIHPSLPGVNVLQSKAFPNYPLEAMIREKSGKMVYSWKNPGEEKMREKLVLFNYIPEYEWIVASSSYLNEFYTPLNKISNVIIFTVLGSLLLLLPLTFVISASITNPLRELINRLEQGAGGNLSVRIKPRSDDELGRMALYFNSFMEKLETYKINIEAEIKERKQAEEALKISEDRYRSVMEAAPDPIVVYDMEGRVIYLNTAFTEVFGWTAKECLGNKLDHFVPDENWEETRKGLATITSGRFLQSIETRRLTKPGRIIDVSTRGAVYRDRHNKLVGSVIIHRDVSDLKRLEKQVMDIGDLERQKIGQDLHDDLCPHLIGIEGLGKVLINKLSIKSHDESLLAEKITDLIKDAITKTRRMARGLCPVYLVDHGLEFSLSEFAQSTSSMFGIPCDFKCSDTVLIKDNLIATHMFHIAQEAVYNAAKHGAATQITIALSLVNNKVILKVTDNGKGFSPDDQTSGMGLRIMGFRANIINASLDIQSEETMGTTIQVSLGINT